MWRRWAVSGVVYYLAGRLACPQLQIRLHCGMCNNVEEDGRGVEERNSVPTDPSQEEMEAKTRVISQDAPLPLG